MRHDSLYNSHLYFIAISICHWHKDSQLHIIYDYIRINEYGWADNTDEIYWQHASHLQLASYQQQQSKQIVITLPTLTTNAITSQCIIHFQQ